MLMTIVKVNDLGVNRMKMFRVVQTDMRNGILFDHYIDIEKRIKAAFNEEYHDYDNKAS